MGRGRSPARSSGLKRVTVSPGARGPAKDRGRSPTRGSPATPTRVSVAIMPRSASPRRQPRPAPFAAASFCGCSASLLSSGSAAALVVWKPMPPAVVPDPNDHRRLLPIHAVPPYLRFNKYILGGYRRLLTPAQCLGSLCWVHNESGNAYTHLVPVVAMSAALLVMPAPLTAQPPFGALVPLTLATGVATLSGSVVYHTFMASCASPVAYDNLLFFDVLGVWFIMATALFAVTFGAFPCAPPLLLLSWFGVPCALSLVLLFRARSAATRGVALGVMSLARLLVTLARALLARNVPGTLCALAGDAVLVLGGVINVKRFPESISPPGRFDIWGNSHQIMHVLVTVAIAFFLNLVAYDAEFMARDAVSAQCFREVLAVAGIPLS